MNLNAGRNDISPISRDLRVRFAAYVGMLASYLSAVKNDPLTPFQLAFFGLAATWSLGFEHRFRKPFFSAPIKIGLIVLGSAIFVLFISGHGRGTTDDFANSIARFLFWNAIVFILSRNKSEYDLWTLAIIELSLFMISGAFVQPPFFLPLLLLSVGSLLYCFQRSAILKCGPSGESEKGGIGLALVTLLFSLEIGAVLFLVFPRDSFRMDKPHEAAAERKPKPGDGAPSVATGDSIGLPRNNEFLDLATFHKLKTNPLPVLQIKATALDGKPVPPEQMLYLRCAVYPRYDKGWHSDWNEQVKRDLDDGKKDGWTPLEPGPPPRRRIVRQRITAKPVSGTLAFAFPDPFRVHLREARVDSRGTFFFAEAPREPITYEVDSALMPIEPPANVPPAPAAAEYLRLPPGLSRVREIAQRVKDTPRTHAKVSQLQQYLARNGFQYSTDPFVPQAGKDAVEHFLEKRQGFCMHYATALALLCRAAGVPARFATGFQVHMPEDGGDAVVKLSDAHAWVEVWYGPEHGWRIYDPTPSLPLGMATPEAPAVASLDLKKEEAKGPPKRWDQFIVDFDPKSQGQAMRDTLQAVVHFLSTLGSRIFSGPVLGTAALIAAIALAGYLLLPHGKRRRLRQIASGFRETTTVEFYRDFLWALSKRGIRKHPAQTAREFAREIRASVDHEGVDFVTDKFYEARFRGTPPTPEDRARIEGIIALLLRKPSEGGAK